MRCLIVSLAVLFYAIQINGFTQDWEPSILYSVQVAASDTEAGGMEIASNWKSEGYNPVRVIQKSGSEKAFKVYLGEFPTFMEAYLLKQALNSEYPDLGAFIKKEPNTDHKSSFSNSSPRYNLLSFETPLETSSGVDAEVTTAMEEIESLLDEKSYQAATHLLENQMAFLGSDDPNRGWYEWKLGIAKHGEKSDEEAEKHFRNVAEGRTAATRKVRLQSLYSIGHLYQSQKKRVEAYRLFHEIKRDVPDGAAKAKTCLQLAAISMELGMSGKGTSEDCRRFCQELLSLPSEDPEVVGYQATGSLIHLETYYLMDTDYEKVIESTDRHLKRFPEANREKEWALLYMGLSHFYSKNYASALASFRRIVDENLPVENQFGGKDPKAFAQLMVASSLYQMGNLDSSQIESEKLIDSPSDFDLAANKAARALHEMILEEK